MRVDALMSLGFFCASVVACGGATPAPVPPITAPGAPVAPAEAPPSAPTASAEHGAPPPPFEDLVKRAAEAHGLAFRKHDGEALVAIYADDACVRGPGRTDACGKDAIRAASHDLFAAFPDARTAYSAAYLMGDVLAVESAWTGTNEGEALGKKPTHRVVGGRVLTFSRLSPSGLVVEQRVYADRASLRAQLASTAPGESFEGLPTTREARRVGGSPAEQADLEIVKATFDKIGADRQGLFLDEAELADLGETTAVPKKKGGLAWIGLRGRGIVDPKVERSGAWAAGDAVVCEYTARGARRLPTGGKGEPVTVHGAEVYRLENGKVKRATRYKDALELSPPREVTLPPAPPVVAP